MTLDNKLKGIILAGGTGSRLRPLTLVTNKHLVPVGRNVMIEYPLSTLKNLGIESITVVTGKEHAGAIMDYLCQSHPELNFSYKVQKEAGGIAQALGLAEDTTTNSKIAVILGDNIYTEDFSKYSKQFQNQDLGAMLFLKQVADPHRFGVAELNGENIISVEEKPKSPKSNLAVTGLYFYDDTVFSKIRKLKPSARGEYEITDVNNMYIQEGKATYAMVNEFWSDAGTHESREHCEEELKKLKYEPNN